MVVAYRFLPARAERAVRRSQLELETRELAIMDDRILAAGRPRRRGGHRPCGSPFELGTDGGGRGRRLRRLDLQS
jgi:hypothetical protein